LSPHGTILEFDKSDADRMRPVLTDVDDVAPECSTVQAMSAVLSRKLIGTRIRPSPETPKNDVSNRAEFCDTNTTRPPTGTPG
jgi:hypothetical protein